MPAAPGQRSRVERLPLPSDLLPRAPPYSAHVSVAVYARDRHGAVAAPWRVTGVGVCIPARRKRVALRRGEAHVPRHASPIGSEQGQAIGQRADHMPRRVTRRITRSLLGRPHGRPQGRPHGRPRRRPRECTQAAPQQAWSQPQSRATRHLSTHHQP